MHLRRLTLHRPARRPHHRNHRRGTPRAPRTRRHPHRGRRQRPLQQRQSEQPATPTRRHRPNQRRLRRRHGPPPPWCHLEDQGNPKRRRVRQLARRAPSATVRSASPACSHRNPSTTSSPPRPTPPPAKPARSKQPSSPTTQHQPPTGTGRRPHLAAAGPTASTTRQCRLDAARHAEQHCHAAPSIAPLPALRVRPASDPCQTSTRTAHCPNNTAQSPTLLSPLCRTGTGTCRERPREARRGIGVGAMDPPAGEPFAS